MVEAWLTSEALPSALVAERPWPGAVRRLRHELAAHERTG
jgi:hypothetical protein